MYVPQTAKLLLQSSELGLPHPLSPWRVSPPLGSGGRTHSLAGEGGGGSQFGRGARHCGTLGGTLWYVHTEKAYVVLPNYYTWSNSELLSFKYKEAWKNAL
jgi:hypothetical protein